MKEIPEELNWIKARSACSLAYMYEKLRLQILEDIDLQNKLPGHARFDMKTGNADFSVMTYSVEGIKSMQFSLVMPHTIRVNNGDGALKFEATLTLNDAGECKLRIDGKELELWQIRRRALEDLFFEARR
ncbi:MAG TPA: hypothetical protein VGI16_12350 [Candidatus Acidoferrum sp.]|jgi:hypothetical protein